MNLNGILNQGNTRFVNCVLQSLLSTRSFPEGLSRLWHNSIEHVCSKNIDEARTGRDIIEYKAFSDLRFLLKATVQVVESSSIKISGQRTPCIQLRM